MYHHVERGLFENLQSLKKKIKIEQEFHEGLYHIGIL